VLSHRLHQTVLWDGPNPVSTHPAPPSQTFPFGRSSIHVLVSLGRCEENPQVIQFASRPEVSLICTRTHLGPLQFIISPASLSFHISNKHFPFVAFLLLSLRFNRQSYWFHIAPIITIPKIRIELVILQTPWYFGMYLFNYLFLLYLPTLSIARLYSIEW
jgi:hypothetical protein